MMRDTRHSKPAGEIDKKSVPRQVSIEHVAEAADVSIATVSRVLNNPDLVAADTAARVQRAIDRLGYRPNLFAKGLITRRSHVLGIALPDIYGEFYSEVLRGADAEARARGYHLLVTSEASIGAVNSTGNGAVLAFGIIDGLAVMVTEPNRVLRDQIARAKQPVVMLDAEDNDLGLDSILVDNEIGAREATEHLLTSVPPDACYFVGGPRENFDTADRAAAFTRALSRAGHTARPDQVSFGQYSVAWGEKWFRDRHRTHRLAGAGLLAGNDEIAYGLMTAALDTGLSIPADLRLIGFDDTRLASVVRPSLTTVRMPSAEVGAAAIRALIARIENPGTPPVRIRLPSKLIIRQSSVVPPASR